MIKGQLITHDRLGHNTQQCTRCWICDDEDCHELLYEAQQTVNPCGAVDEGRRRSESLFWKSANPKVVSVRSAKISSRGNQ